MPGASGSAVANIRHDRELAMGVKDYFVAGWSLAAGAAALAVSRCCDLVH